MNTSQVYFRYKTPKNLQEHMLAVAGVGTILTSSWYGPDIDLDAIIKCLLFHDIAKPVTFDADTHDTFVQNSEELKTLQECVQYMTQKYGSDEHGAAKVIFDEIGLSKNTTRIMDNLEWSNTDKLLALRDYESLIVIYSDMRVGPDGVISLVDRLTDLHERKPIKDFRGRLNSAKALERILQSNIYLDIKTITDADARKYAQKYLEQHISS